MDMMKIGTFLQNFRKEKNFTPQELADYFHVSNKTVSKWECGKALPEIPLLKEISEFYSVSVDEILNGERNVEGAMENTMRKEEMQKAYQKKKKMWSIFIYLCFILCLIISVCFITFNFFYKKSFTCHRNINCYSCGRIICLWFRFNSF